MAERPALTCFRCGRSPSEIAGYREFAADDGMTPDDWVWEEEGTLNRVTGHFACDGCYIAVGMPTAPCGWTAP